ncbi:hypothetical protein B0T17DRAFT_109781 [Bombardia bombarda]|uniref:Uncharacterized protein n=1 Tax=Bombardia bombarda TaxID=252184 RepID=A0AA40CG13_9PEZI|nr:hypothetical protein B0T17DRAFT_109781 [Bombardia bombarda]
MCVRSLSMYLYVPTHPPLSTFVKRQHPRLSICQTLHDLQSAGLEDRPMISPPLPFFYSSSSSSMYLISSNLVPNVFVPASFLVGLLPAQPTRDYTYHDLFIKSPGEDFTVMFCDERKKWLPIIARYALGADDAALKGGRKQSATPISSGFHRLEVQVPKHHTSLTAHRNCGAPQLRKWMFAFPVFWPDGLSHLSILHQTSSSEAAVPLGCRNKCLAPRCLLTR